MKPAPQIDIVVTCYNYGHYVGRAIESALGQSYERKQVIVVNDGSTDDSLTVINQYRERICVIDQNNQGSIPAYNRGFAASSGEVVIFLDADDLLEPDALARIASAWVPACAKVQYDLAIIDATDKKLGRRFCHFDPTYDAARVRDSFRRNGTYRWPVTVGNAYSRWFLQELFPLDVERGPDGMLNTVAPLYGDVITIAAELACYRMHGENMWTTTGSDLDRLPFRIEDRLRELAALREYASKRGTALSDENPLDHEIAFINYRLMCKKLRLPYKGSRFDSTPRLLAKACETLLAERYPLKMSVAHALWFGALALSPEPVARSLITFRFERHKVRERVRKPLQRLFARKSRPRAETAAL